MVPARYIQKVGQDGRKAVSLDDFINKNKDQPRVLLVTAMPTTPVLIKALSLEFLNRIQFGEAKFSNQDIVTKLNVQKAPSIFVFEASKTEPIKYDGEIKQESLLKFLSSFAGDEVKPSASSKKSGKMSNLFKNCIMQLM